MIRPITLTVIALVTLAACSSDQDAGVLTPMGDIPDDPSQRPPPLTMPQSPTTGMGASGGFNAQPGGQLSVGTGGGL